MIFADYVGLFCWFVMAGVAYWYGRRDGRMDWEDAVSRYETSEARQIRLEKAFAQAMAAKMMIGAVTDDIVYSFYIPREQAREMGAQLEKELAAVPMVNPESAADSETDSDEEYFRKKAIRELAKIETEKANG